MLKIGLINNVCIVYIINRMNLGLLNTLKMGAFCVFSDILSEDIGKMERLILMRLFHLLYQENRNLKIGP